jgi:hypothetical protein
MDMPAGANRATKNGERPGAEAPGRPQQLER